eukprot:s2734_g2.t1
MTHAVISVPFSPWYAWHLVTGDANFRSNLGPRRRLGADSQNPSGLAKREVSDLMSCCEPQLGDGNAVEIDHVQNVDEAPVKNPPPQSAAKPQSSPPPPETTIAKVEEADDDMPMVELKQEVSEEPKKRPPMASFCKLFSMMDCKEAAILIIGILGAIGNGISQPLLCIVFGDLIDSMGISMTGASLASANMTAEEMATMQKQAMDQMMSKMEELCLIMALVGVGNIVASSLQGACFKIFSELQATKFRILYFDIVIHQDVSWFDLKEVAALPAEINDDLETLGRPAGFFLSSRKIQDAFGDKFGNGIMAFSAFLGGFGCAFGMGALARWFGCLAVDEEDLLPSVSNVLLTCLAFAAPDDENFQALCAACRGSRAAELETLLRSPIEAGKRLAARADHNAAVFEDGATPLHLAAGEGKVEVVQKLLESRAALEMTLHCGRTALHCAAQEGQAEVVRLLLDAQAEKDGIRSSIFRDDHCSPLTLASSRGHLDVVRLLIEASADVDYSLPWSEGFGTTALHMAATSGFAEVVQALLKGGATKLGLLVSQVDPLFAMESEWKDKAVSGGLTPLHVACRFGRLEVVRALIEAGAERNAATSQDGKKPLELAMEFGHHEVVHFLRAPLNDLSVDSLPPSTPDTGFVSAE